jgi:hypothetical protein
MSYRSQIDEKCKECSGGSAENCSGKDCPLWKYRIKKKKEENSDLKEAIRLKCLDCCGDSIRILVTCTSKSCPLYTARREAIGREVFDNESEIADIFC